MTAGQATPVPDPASAAPRGTRVRAGNAMGRTRSAVAAGTAAAIREHGARKATMIDIAAAASIAKGTLYNHVRTRSEAYQLLAETEVARLVELLRSEGDPARALREAGDFVANHPVVRSLADREPAALAVVCLPGPLTASSRALVDAAAERLVGSAGAPLVVRWLLSLLLEPGDEATRAAQATALVATVGRLGSAVYRAPQAG